MFVLYDNRVSRCVHHSGQSKCPGRRSSSNTGSLNLPRERNITLLDQGLPRVPLSRLQSPTPPASGYNRKLCLPRCFRCFDRLFQFDVLGEQFRDGNIFGLIHAHCARQVRCPNPRCGDDKCMRTAFGLWCFRQLLLRAIREAFQESRQCRQVAWPAPAGRVCQCAN